MRRLFRFGMELAFSILFSASLWIYANSGNMKMHSFLHATEKCCGLPCSSGPPSILVVDDDPDIVLTLQDLLKSEGYKVNTASNGANAVGLVKTCTYDAVILDVRLPDVDGFLVLQAMTELTPGLPIILLTDYTTLDSATVSLEEHGAFDYFHKPINRTAMRTAVRHAVGAQVLARKIEQARHALQESEGRFQAVFDAAIDAIVLANHQGLIMSWNPAAEKMFGYKAEEIFGKSLTLIMPARYREAHEEGMKRIQTTGEPLVLRKTLSLYGLRKNGQEFPIELSLNSWSNGPHLCYSGFIRDISARNG